MGDVNFMHLDMYTNHQRGYASSPIISIRYSSIHHHATPSPKSFRVRQEIRKTNKKLAELEEILIVITAKCHYVTSKKHNIFKPEPGCIVMGTFTIHTTRKPENKPSLSLHIIVAACTHKYEKTAHEIAKEDMFCLCREYHIKVKDDPTTVRIDKTFSSMQ